jgi:hypothetical protein
MFQMLPGLCRKSFTKSPGPTMDEQSWHIDRLLLPLLRKPQKEATLLLVSQPTRLQRPLHPT